MPKANPNKTKNNQVQVQGMNLAREGVINDHAYSQPPDKPNLRLHVGRKN